MIIVNLIGGLGNQMFQYAVGRNLSFRLGTELKLDISGFQTYELRSYELGVFDLQGAVATEKEVFRAKFGRMAWIMSRFSNRGDKKPKPGPLYIREKHFQFDPDVLKLPDGVYLEGYWQSEAYFREIADVIRRDFSIRIPPSDENRRIAENLAFSDSVSIHVRRGDYASNPTTNAYHGLLGPEYYGKAIELVAAKVPDARFFVFSDEPDWVKANFKADVPFVVVDANDGAHAYEDLRLMASCRHHILANSSFSWWGAWLAPTPEKIVIAPKRWFQDPSVDTSDLVPESWTRI